MYFDGSSVAYAENGFKNLTSAQQQVVRDNVKCLAGSTDIVAEISYAHSNTLGSVNSAASNPGYTIRVQSSTASGNSNCLSVLYF